MTPDELDALLAVAQRRGVTRLKLYTSSLPGELEVEMAVSEAHIRAIAPAQPAPTREPRTEDGPETIEERVERIGREVLGHEGVG